MILYCSVLSELINCHIHSSKSLIKIILKEIMLDFGRLILLCLPSLLFATELELDTGECL
jgi:hypothetical protein